MAQQARVGEVMDVQQAKTGYEQRAKTDHIQVRFLVGADDSLTLEVYQAGEGELTADGDCAESVCAMLEELQRRAFRRGMRVGRRER